MYEYKAVDGEFSSFDKWVEEYTAIGYKVSVYQAIYVPATPTGQRERVIHCALLERKVEDSR